jgi:hypothetical protein
MLCGIIIVVCSENHRKRTWIHCVGKMHVLFNVKNRLYIFPIYFKVFNVNNIHPKFSQRSYCAGTGYLITHKWSVYLFGPWQWKFILRVFTWGTVMNLLQNWWHLSQGDHSKTLTSALNFVIWCSIHHYCLWGQNFKRLNCSSGNSNFCQSAVLYVLP